MQHLRRAALAATFGLLVLYLAVFPGSLLTLALGQVPAWGEWMGAALLLLQGAAAVCWLAGFYGWRGVLAGVGLLALGYGAEKLGITTGFPFGDYYYTDVLQPQLFNVPLPIASAWLMAGLGAWQLAQVARVPGIVQTWVVLLTATLVTVLDLQLETVTTLVNRYWVWVDTGPYYSVPPVNFLAWWVLGAMQALVLERLVLSRGSAGAPNLHGRRPTVRRAIEVLPGILFLCNSVMFTVVNATHGYTLAALVGVVMLAVAAWITARGGVARVAAPAFGRSVDQFPADHA